MTSRSDGDRLERIEATLEQVAILFQQQGQINNQLIQQGQNTQRQIEGLQGEIQSVLAGIDQLHQIVMKRERDHNGEQY